MNENQVNQVNQFETGVSSVENKNNKKKMIGLVAIILIGFASIFGVYKIVFDNPKNVFLNAVNKEFKKFGEIFESSLNIKDKESVIIDSSLDFDINVMDGMLTTEQMSLLNEINALGLKVNTQYDSKNKQLAYNMNVKYNVSDLFKFGIYGKPNSLYVDLKNYFDKYIEIPFEEYETLFEEQNADLENIEYMLNFVKESFVNNLNKKDFMESKANILIGSENIKVNKITYTLTEKKLLELMSKVFEDIKKDDKFIKTLSSMSDEEAEQLKKSLDETIQSINDELDGISDYGSSIDFSVYTKGIMNEAVQFSVATNSSDGSKIELCYSNYKDIKRISMLEDGTTIISIVNSKEKENVYKTKLTADTLELVIDSTKTGDSWNNKYRLTETESTSIINGEFSSTVKEITKDKEYTNDIKFTASLGMEDMEDVITISFVNNNTLKLDQTVTLPDLGNSVVYTSLTEEQTNKIIENISNNQNIIDFVNKISSYMGTDIDDEDIMYDYDDTDY